MSYSNIEFDSKTNLKHLAAYAAQLSTPVAALVFDSTTHQAMLVRLAEKMLDHLITPIVVTPPSITSIDLPAGIPHYILDNDDFRHMENVDVCIATDSWRVYPTSTRIIFIPHSCVQTDWKEGDLTSELARWGYSFMLADALFMHHPDVLDFSPDQARKIWGNQYPKCQPRPNDFVIIPGGYPKIDLLMENIGTENHPKDAVLVMPSQASKAPHGSFATHVDMIDAVWAAIEDRDDLDIIFRPFGPDREHEQAKALVEKYKDDPRIRLDLNNSNIQSFSSAQLMVTDFSFGRVSFSLATCLPNISYDPTLNKQLERTPLGFDTFSPEQLTEATRLALNELDTYSQSIPSIRQNMLLNPGTAYDCLIDSALAFAHGEKRNYWVSFKRDFAQGDWDDPKDWHRFLATVKCGPSNHLQAIAKERFADSTLFDTPLYPGCYVALRIDYANGKDEQLSYDELQGFRDAPTTLPSYAIWGASQNYLDSYQEMMLSAPDSCLGFFDSDPAKWEQIIDGKEIMNPSELLSRKPEIVFLATSASSQVRTAIQKLLNTTN